MNKEMAEVLDRFVFHPAVTEEIEHAHQVMRSACYDLAALIMEGLPSCRERSLAITHLENVMHWGNKAIALHMGREKP